MNIFEKLGLALPGVENPARYIGGEANSVIKDHSAMLAKMAFVFPDIYEIGMSNNGMRILYHVINREPDLLCEVAFAPWDDMAKEMRRLEIPLYTHATYTAVKEFEAIGISLQTELNFTNVPYVLELAGVSAFSAERAPSWYAAHRKVISLCSHPARLQRDSVPPTTFYPCTPATAHTLPAALSEHKENQIGSTKPVHRLLRQNPLPLPPFAWTDTQMYWT